MSSPITARTKGRFAAALIAVHQRLSHGKRVEILAQRIADVIQEHRPGAPGLRCLDVGCGDMRLAEQVAALAPGTDWTCIDIHPLPAELGNDARWRKYRTFDGINIPFPDGHFDIILFADVLHHVQTNAPALLADAGRAGKAVVVKDHFERSRWSRLMLRALDFAGNWGYGVSLPKRYFTRQGFEDMAAEAGLRPLRIDAGLELYAHLPLIRLLLRPEWQFIALLAQDPSASERTQRSAV